MSQFVSSVKDVSKNYNKYDKWEQSQADEIAQKAYLVKHLNVGQDKIDLTKQRAKTVIRATEIMDTRSENNCENVEQVTAMIAAVPALGLSFAQLPVTRFLEKRFNSAPETELKNLKKVFESAQTEEAKVIAQKKIKELSQKIDKNRTRAANIGIYGTIGAMFAISIGMILWGNSKQKEASRIGRFQAKQNELKGIENFINYTPEQIAEAEKIAQKIPDKKERNSISQAIHELKEMGRDASAYKKWAKTKDPNEIEKLKAGTFTEEELKQGNIDKELITNTVSEINIKAEEFSENLENAFDTFGTLSFLLAAPIGFCINNLLRVAKVSPKINTIVSFAIPTLTTIGISMAGTFEQKDAARIGRYYARKDLMEHPYKLMAFSDEEMAQAKDIKAPKQKIGLFEKIGKSFKFLKDYYKQKKEYKNYKEKVQKHNEKLQEAFKHIKTTNEQKIEAKKLQQNVFRAFDEVDEMSQRYSEDIEAGTEIAKSLASTIWEAGSILGLGLLGAGIAKGKISLIKPTKWLNNLTLDKNSSIRSSLNKFLDTLVKEDKSVRQEFQKALCHGNLEKFLADSKHANIKSNIESIKNEVKNISTNPLKQIAKSGEVNIKELVNEELNKHFKQTIAAKWMRNLVFDTIRLRTRLFLKSHNNEIPKEMLKEFDNTINKNIPVPFELQKEMGLNFNYKNYKTLINTSVVAGLPILGTIFAVPYMFNAWLTDIQKKAGKIGVMKAMQKLDDPRIFVQKQES